VQIIYAAPFVLLSVAAFFACLALPRLRPYALQALVVPVAFGACSIIAFALIAVTWAMLNERFGLVPPHWAPLTVCAIAYVAFGIVGARFAVRLVQRRFHSSTTKKAQGKRTLVLRLVTSFILPHCGAYLSGLWVSRTRRSSL
jgi:hypothetical protein